VTFSPGGRRDCTGAAKRRTTLTLTSQGQCSLASDALNVTPRALYHHVSSKTDLLRCVANRVLSEVAPPEPGLAWPQPVLAIAAELRRVLIAHP